MKVKILCNRIKVNIDDDLQRVIDYNKYHGYDVSFTKQDTDLPLPIPVENGTDGTQKQYVIKMRDACANLIDGVTIFAYNSEELTVPADGYITSSAGEGHDFITLRTNGYDDQTSFIWKAICHECIHVYFRKLKTLGIFIDDPMDSVYVNGTWQSYYHNDNPDYVGGNYAIAWERLQPYKNLLENNMQTYKYFKDSEIVGLKPELVALLDQMRDRAGTPFIIASGLRTPAQNVLAGGVSNSAHLKGLAVDLHSKDAETYSKIVAGIMQFRDKVFVEFAGNHIHVDIDASIHPLGNAIWGNDSN